MKINFLFPNRFKRLTGFCFYLLLLLGGSLFFTDNMDFLSIKVPNFFGMEGLFIEKGFWIKNAVLDELFTVLIIIFGIIHSFSKEKIEDELIIKIRSDAMMWAFYFNYIIVLVSTLILFDTYYLKFMVINIFSLIIFFNLRYHYKLRKHYRS